MLLASVLLVFASDVSAIAADGDPPLEVPTLEQGRALLARDVLHRQCEGAILQQDWSKVIEYADKALLEEKTAFGKEFEGSEATNLYRNIAKQNTGQAVALPFELEVVRLEKMPGFNPSAFSNDELNDLDTLAVKLKKDSVSEAQQIYSEMLEIVSLHIRSISTLTFEELDRKAIKLAIQLDATREGISKPKHELRQLIEKREMLKAGQGQPKAVPGSMWREINPPDNPALSFIYVLASNAAVRSDDDNSALQYAQRAFTMVAKADPAWHEDERATFGGKAIAERYRQELFAAAQNARSANQWEKVVERMNDCRSWVSKLDTEQEFACLTYLDEAKAVLKLSNDLQESYVERVVRPKVFNETDAFEIQLQKLLAVRKVRMSLIGPTEQDAFDANSAAVLSSRINKSIDAANWARVALHQFLLRRGGENSWVKTSSNNYRQQLLKFVRDEPSKALHQSDVDKFSKSTEMLRQRLGEHAITAQYEIALQELESRFAFNQKSLEQLAALDELQRQRDNAFRRGAFERAIEFAMEALPISERLWGTDSWITAENKRGLANCFTKSGQSEKAIKIFESVETQFNRYPFDRSADFGWFLHGYASALSQNGSLEDSRRATQLLEQAARLEARLRGKLSPYAAHIGLAAQILRDQLRDSAAALPLSMEAINILSGLGDESQWDYCNALVNLGLVQTNLGLYKAADESYRKSLNIRRTAGFQNPHMEAWNQWALGKNAFYSHRFGDSIRSLSTAAQLKEKHSPGASDLDSIYGQIINAACLAGNRALEEYVDGFIKSATSRHGSDSIEFANACQSVCFHLGESPDPGPGFETKMQREILQQFSALALHIYERHGINGNRRAIYLRKSFADAIQLSPKKSLALYREVIELSERHSPVLWDAIGLSHVGMSNIFRDRLNSPEQCIYHRRLALEGLANAFGDQSPQVANLLLGQASVLVRLGDFEKAGDLAEESLQLTLTIGTNPIEQYMLLSRIAARRGQLNRAEQYLYTARNELDNRKFAESYDRSVRLALGDLAIKQKDFQRAKSIAEGLFTNVSDDTDLQTKARFNAKAILGKALLGLNQYGQANEVLDSVLKQAKSSDAESPLIVGTETQRAYARSCMFVGDEKQSHQLLDHQLREAIARLESTAAFLSPRQRLAQRASVDACLDAYLSFCLSTDRSPESIYERVFDVKGIVSDQIAKRKRLVSDDPKHLELLEQLATVNRNLSASMFGKRQAETKDVVDLIQRLTSERETVQLQIAEYDRNNDGADANAEKGQLLLSDLQRGLKDSTLIDFLIFNHSDLFSSGANPRTSPSTTQSRCIAFVLKGNSIDLVELGSVNKLGSGITKWRRSIQGATAMFEAANSDLYQKIWAPIEKHLPQEGQLLLSVDGPLQQLSFAALADGKNGYLIDHYTISMLPSPRNLLRSTQEPGSGTERLESDQVLLVGGVNYQQQTTIPPKHVTTQLLAQTSAQTDRGLWAKRSNRGVGWSYLSGTAEEIDAISATLKRAASQMVVRKVTGHDANEATVGLLAQQARFLHLATHGFFAESSRESAWQLQSLSRNAVSAFDPQLLTGIVLSGANGDPTADRGDGILTAAEIETLDLRQTEVAVLSACETALGETASGEGVLGLQRALHLAGCQHVVASQWQVNDRSTMVLMTQFYKNVLQKKMSKVAALRDAQRWMLNNPTKVFHANASADLRAPGGVKSVRKISKEPGQTEKRLEPKFWAAFTVSGYSKRNH